MIRNVLIATFAATALASTSVFAKPGGGQGVGAGNANVNANVNVNAGGNARIETMGGPSGAALDARINSMGPENASPRALERASPNSVLRTRTDPNGTPAGDARTNSRGLDNASPRGISRANPNSALARGAVEASALPGLEAGLTVQTDAGVALGTVTQVVTGTDGSIRLVIVTSPTGETIRLLPTALTMDGDVVVATATTVGG